MKIKFLAIVSFVLLMNNLIAQETPPTNLIAANAPKNLEDSLRVGWWVRNTQVGVNFSQAAFSNNWAGGGINNYALGLLFGHKADYHRGKGIWANELQLQYGITNSGQGSRKSLDKIFFDSKYLHKISKVWNWFGGINILSQFARGYDYKYNSTNFISSFFSPLYIAEGFGVEYRPTDYFNLQLGGATLRQTIVSTDVINNFIAYKKAVDNKDVTEAYGVAKGKNLLNELGFQLVANYNRDIVKNINLKLRYQAFFAYAPTTNLSHRLDLVTAAKINKYLNVNITVIGIYDKNIVDDIQISEGLAIGFLYTM